MAITFRTNTNPSTCADSDNGEAQMSDIMEVVVISSEMYGSDVEMIPYNPIEILNSSSMDQPSTSTGFKIH